MICNFSKIAFHVFNYPIHWYSLAYIIGIISAFRLTKYIITKYKLCITDEIIDNFLHWIVIGIILGGRLGFVLFYEFDYYASHPSDIIKVWHGGMSFYGGFLGFIVSTYIFCKKHKLNFLNFIDIWSISAPIGLFLGRIANFINGELLGKPSTTIPWNVIFSDGISRHPSQIYESICEGLLLFIIMIFSFKRSYKYNGKLSGIFCIGYSSARFICELFREPDSDLSYTLYIHTSINFNQYISILMFAIGYMLIIKASKSKITQ